MAQAGLQSTTIKNPATPEAIRYLEGLGFVTLYDADGNATEFMERQHYEKCVADGLISPDGRVAKISHK